MLYLCFHFENTIHCLMPTPLKILNANPGYGAPLGEQEIRNFLTTKVLNLHFGTIDEKGHALIEEGENKITSKIACQPGDPSVSLSLKHYSINVTGAFSFGINHNDFKPVTRELKGMRSGHLI